MNIIFSTLKLERLANNDQKRLKALGKIRSDKFRDRLAQLSVAETLEEVRYLPGKYHELTGDRKGQWSCDLDQPYRLIFKPLEDPIPVNEDGQYVWAEIKGVEIVAIIDYH